MPKKPPKSWAPASDLQITFIHQLNEAMRVRGLNPHSLSKRKHAPPQRTINDIIRGRDTKLEQIEKLGKALNLSPLALLTNGADVRPLRQEILTGGSSIKDAEEFPEEHADSRVRTKRKK